MNLTRTQILDNRAKAITEAANNYASSEDEKTYWEDLSDEEKQLMRFAAQATIEADEKAGVLMLVDEGEQHFKQGDVVMDKWGDALHIHSDEFMPNVEKIIQRANTLTYNCKKEGAE